MAKRGRRAVPVQAVVAPSGCKALNSIPDSDYLTGRTIWKEIRCGGKTMEGSEFCMLHNTDLRGKYQEWTQLDSLTGLSKEFVIHNRGNTNEISVFDRAR